MMNTKKLKNDAFKIHKVVPLDTTPILQYPCLYNTVTCINNLGRFKIIIVIIQFELLLLSMDIFCSNNLYKLRIAASLYWFQKILHILMT